jgi:hypothetical protein
VPVCDIGSTAVPATPSCLALLVSYRLGEYISRSFKVDSNTAMFVYANNKEKCMNWDAIGAVGELLGSVAVLVTLVYLAIQVRHARAEASRALGHGRMEANRAVVLLDLDDEILSARIKAEAAFGTPPIPIVSLLMERANLSEKEAWILFIVEVARWNYRTHVIAHWDELPPSEQMLFDKGVRVRMASSLSRFMYDNHFKSGAHPDVVRYLDRVLS